MNEANDDLYDWHISLDGMSGDDFDYITLRFDTRAKANKAHLLLIVVSELAAGNFTIDNPSRGYLKKQPLIIKDEFDTRLQAEYARRFPPRRYVDPTLRVMPDGTRLENMPGIIGEPIEDDTYS